jgi:hypothetical protein
MDPLTWPSHPNVALRERVAHYLERGYQIRSLEADAAVVTRRNLIARAMQLKFNPFTLFNSRWNRDHEVMISVGPDGELRETGL